MSAAPFDVPRAQRWFAVEFNNVAWDLLEKPGRTAEETERMVHVAHASVQHWLAAGNELNRLRGMVLLANVYAAAGLAEAAVRYGAQALTLSDVAGDAQTPFDRATSLAAASRAYLLAGDGSRSKQLDLAHQASEKLDADERTIFDQLCPKTANAKSAC